MTIVKHLDLVLGHPFERLGNDLRTRLHQSTGLKSSTRSRWLPFEAFLQVTNHPGVDNHDLGTEGLQRTVELFIGALHSRKFIADSQKTTYIRSWQFVRALQAVDPYHPWNAKLSPTHVYDEVEGWRRDFEEIPLNEEKAWLWGGWGSRTKRGENVSFPLYPIYERLGRQFTQRFAEALDTRVSRQSSKTVKVLGAFCRYIGETTEPVAPEFFQDRYWCGRILTEFAHHYFKEMKAKGNIIRHAASGWRGYFAPLVESLSENGVIAAPEPPLPSPRAGTVVKGSETNITRTKDGAEIKTNCLTEIPLSLSDSDAKEILFRDIREDFAAVVTWAEAEVDDIWRRHTAAKELAESGTVRPLSRPGASTGVLWLTDPLNPEALANCAATYWSTGHIISPFTNTVYGRMGLIDVANRLGTPTPGSLLPHAAMLVANHCEMTSEFLSSLELFDKDGKLHGFIEMDGGAYLVGYKRRRGEKLAEQKILLNTRTTQVVRQVIALTAPLRECLKRMRNDKWRLLFLTAHGIGGTPVGQHFSNQCCKPERYGDKGMVASFVNKVSMSEAESVRLVESFSLRSLRASAALIVYLNTESALKMSQALGHETYNPQLLDHYLPEPIQRFFRERWIRLFQAGLICEALKDSEFLLEASGFSSMEELDQFLERHALKQIPSTDGASESKERGRKTQVATQVVFEVSESVLTALLSVMQAVEQTAQVPSGRAVYWAEVGRRVSSYIESLADRPDLTACLTAAKERASADLVAGLVNG